MDLHHGAFDERRFGKYFIFITFILFLIAFVAIIKPFILQILTAAVVATLFHPFFRFVLKYCGKRRWLAALISCILIMVSVLIPLVVISRIVILQGIDLYTSAVPLISDIIQKGNEGIIGKFLATSVGQWILSHNINIDWQKLVSNAVNYIGASTAQFVNQASRATIVIIFDFFVTIFSLFYFLRDGNKILLRIKEYLPLSEDHKEKLISTFSVTANALVKSVVLIGSLQALLGTLTLWIFGIETWLLWGGIMLILSVIPFVGTGPVLIPAGIIKIVTGDVWQGGVIILISIFLISSIDNVLRPRVVGYSSGMHDLVVFFAMVGGIAMFGPLGLIVGPLVAAIFLSLLEIYALEFKKHIEFPNRPIEPKV